MACGSYTLKSIASNQCLDNMGGIKRIYMVENDLVTKVEKGLTEDVNKIATITLTEAAKWKEFNFRKGTGSMTTSTDINNENGTLTFKTDVSLKFPKANDANRSAIMAMVMEGSVAVVEDSMGKYWFLGEDYPVSASAAGQESGTAFADFTGYTVTLTDNSRELPRELTAEAITAIESNIEPAEIA